MAPKNKAIVFSDFDGTITLKDSNDFLTDNVGYGPERRRQLNIEILEGKLTFRDAFQDMLKSIKLPFPDCIELLKKNIKLDPGFATFNKWCIEQDIPVIVVSSGMDPIIRELLAELVGQSAYDMPVISNGVRFSDNSWDIEYRDESDFGHDKSRAIKPYAQLPDDERPILFYCGDGVSDLSAARETDLLFAKHGHDLITYCEREGIPFSVFHSFEDIHRNVKAIIEGKTTIEQVAAQGKKQAKEEEPAKEQPTVK